MYFVAKPEIQTQSQKNQMKKFTCIYNKDKFPEISSSNAHGLLFCYFVCLNVPRLNLHLNFYNKAHMIHYGCAVFKDFSNDGSMFFESVCMFTPTFRFALYV